MQSIHRKTPFLIALVAAIVLLSACTKNLTEVTTVYSNDFNDGNLKDLQVLGWVTNVSTGIFPPGAKLHQYQGSTMIGRLNNSRVEITVGQLPEHDVVRVEFDLYVHETWKNDIFVLRFDDQFRLITGFSTDSTVKQSYPNWVGNGSTMYPAGNMAQELYLPSPCGKNVPRGTNYYRMIHSMAHTEKSIKFDISDTGGALNDTCNRSWSVDNLKITVLNNQ
ncbi:MAG TPA: hypothetical protein VJA82_07120 [Sediminibacterium sp.]|uniref:hypothetical protein n=1 Tax=Sediminibacterium sp. TaxID=1917865 RepID=UPI0008C26915|nr:hypothetical protein [Sediminibacterium sp.]OHC84563.1 MAG: hypothetical protein A2472_11420 [Sphingobacteriia bacterium RIFOXYC2_FULL_35_18]OHC87484.1 MAG: hypothetical protein A2546_07835 [Sphingobacteriia bacterium RIFOXYD2_FULL_35_12]HLD53055.1 hypothetical protein [Sediminibacterium sp.]